MKIMTGLIAIAVIVAFVIFAGCVETEEVPSTPTSTPLAPTPTPEATSTKPPLSEDLGEKSTIPAKGVQLPPETKGQLRSLSVSHDVYYERSASGMLTGICYNETRRVKYSNINYTYEIKIIFKGLGGGEAVKRTDTFIIPEIQTTGDVNRPNPIFSPMQIVTDYESKISYVIIENVGGSGKVTLTVDNKSVVFYIDKGEKVKASIHSTKGRTYYLKSLETIKYQACSTWKVRPYVYGDVSKDGIDVERI